MTENKWAILVGANEYDDSTFNSLRFSVDDVKDLRGILIEPKRGGYDDDKTVLLTDGSQKNSLPTRSNIMSRLSSVAKTAETEDTILFAFSGHGMEENGSSYLLPADAQAGILMDTAIEVKWIKKTLSESPARAKIMILDACHAGAMKGKAESGEMTEGFSKETLDLPEGFALLSSCKLHESSYEWDEKKHGVFSFFLCEGLNGDADKDRDGVIAVPEASSYVTQKVKEWAFKKRVQQSPNLEYRVSGDLILTHVPGSFRPTLNPLTTTTEECVTSIILLHIKKFAVTAQYFEFGDNPEWDEKAGKAKSGATEMAKELCAKLIDFYDVDQITAKSNEYYTFPDGSISISTVIHPDDDEVESHLEVTTMYDPARKNDIDKVVRCITSWSEWHSLEYRLNKKFDLVKLVELFKKSGISIVKYDPTRNSPIVVSAPGWGATGNPARVYFANSKDGSSISIFQKYYKRDQLEDDFYDRLNPKAIVEFVNPALA